MTTSKCSKTKGEFCRIHNPAPIANSVETVTQKINSLFDNKDNKTTTKTSFKSLNMRVANGETIVTISFADGTESDIPVEAEQGIIGIVQKEGLRILVGKVKRPDAFYPYTPCCTGSKTRVYTNYIEDDENGDYELKTLVCDLCDEPVDKVYGDFIYNETVISRI
jgi:hypothetical protein